MAQEFSLEVIPVLPTALERMEELANNLWYSWNVPARTLFEKLDYELWIRVGHNPKLFLRNVDQNRLNKAANDPLFLSLYRQVMSEYDIYHSQKEKRHSGKNLADDDLIAYFCAEYGFHESLPVYSGGLGILAGDHCKTASDLRLPFVGVGLFYHSGYFTQLIDNEGNQRVKDAEHDTQHLPIHSITDEHGNDILVSVDIAGHQVWIKAWKVEVGHICMYWLDTRVPQNNAEDAAITYQLYGGDSNTRIQQEIVLGIGGVRMLRKLGINPTVWHMNEGHAAFLVLERLREYIHQGLHFPQAKEVVANSCVFTTHTPVPAGHDHFSREAVMHYLGSFANELRLSAEDFLNLGCEPSGGNPDFNMTTLAINLSRHMNGVSRIHGGVSSKICSRFWPDLTPTENPMTYVTNGVHVASFLSRQWSDLFDKYLGAEWRDYLCDADFWQRIENIPDKEFWETHQAVKSRMLTVVRDALLSQHLRNQVSETYLEHLLKYIDPNNPNVLTVGFARRFATYKRATLLAKDRNRLRELLLDEDRPIVFIFAGKAHPADEPGQQLIREIYRLGNEPDFIGKILMVQGYDMGLSRRLVSGVDVWLNNPVYPLEASGTSGMKAAINAAINLSILDGWWAEGFESDNGWGIRSSPHNEDEGRRDEDDARNLYDILQNEVVTSYYEGGKYNYSPSWVKRAKRSMATVMPRFNMVRMLNEYLDRLYIPASIQGKLLSEENYQKAQVLADWKAKVRHQWGGIHIRQLAGPPAQLQYDQAAKIEVAIHLNGLEPNDVMVELLLSRKLFHPEILVSTSNQDNVTYIRYPNDDPDPSVAYRFTPQQGLDHGEYLYTLDFQPDWCGDLSYTIRIFPYHPYLSDPHEMGMMRWA